MRRLFARFFRGERKGQGLIEYSLLIAFVGLAAVAILSSIGDGVWNIWDYANTTTDSANSSATGNTTSPGAPAPGHHHHHDHGDNGDNGG